MSAAETAASLGDERKDGRDVKCRCPRCGGRLALRDGDHGLLAKCWGGCEAHDVYAELRRLGYLSGERPAPLSPNEIAARNAVTERERRRKIAKARDLWGEAHPIADTLGDHYLRVPRGLDILSPSVGEAAANVLRFHSRFWHSSPSICRPALLAKIEHTKFGFIGVSATYLAMDGSGKTTLKPPRKVFGLCKGGAVRFGNPEPRRWFIVGEGIETTLSLMQCLHLPGWAALSASGLANLILPAEAKHVVIAADNDRNGVGQGAANEAARRFLAEGRRCRVFMPPVAGMDWNDVLSAKAPTDLADYNHGS
jgi:putative DNA primase/helicase